MRLLHEEYGHPTQGRVGLSVFELAEGFLVTEERAGTATVVKTLGLFADREAALSRARARGAELLGQRYTTAVSTASASPSESVGGAVAGSPAAAPARFA
jgi:hypothetical protein